MGFSSTRIARFALVAGAVLAVTPAAAASIESATIENWTLTAYTNTRTNEFQSCTMVTPAGEGTDFILSLNTRNRWGLWLRRSEWPFERDTTVVATLNIDAGRKAPIAIETVLRGERILALPLAREDRLPDLFDRATAVRVALEHGLHVNASLKNYAKAVDWVKACVRRHAVPESAAAPDATIRSDKSRPGPLMGREDGTLEMEPETRDAKPSLVVPGRSKPGTNPDLIEASAKSEVGASDSKPAVAVPALPAATPAPPTAKPAPTSPSQIVAGIAAALVTAAHATSDITEPRQNGARELVPNLMQAAKFDQFKILTDFQPPAALQRADAAFELDGLKGAVVGIDASSAGAGMNDVLARDRIACGGNYTSHLTPADAASPDVLRATSRCDVAGQVTIGHFLTLGRKGGGFYVVAVTAPAAAPTVAGGAVAAVTMPLDEAALSVTGKF